MIKITQYQAFDGTLFNDENDCLEYEKQKELSNGTYLEAWDREKKVMRVVNPRKAWYVKCNKDGMYYFNYLCDTDGALRIVDNDNLCNSSDILYWYWDNHQYRWVNFDVQLQDVKDCCKMFGIPFGQEDEKEELQ